ncbi:helix-turn-helix transcriptional regulator [Micromonospora sp. FIMYZ51]|uniref:helix-turn-helix transcriptional regulator n=1 Tax=Micromonospora sp. FIMYZ51 TaxID=3051832 RepID=UPI00311F42D2
MPAFPAPVADTAASTTSSVHIAAITRAVTTMRLRVNEPHRLHDIAHASLMSPFHFHRVFRLLTAVTPGRFLTAVRMAEAKRLLLHSSASATDISVAVGYSSFGTFTTQFTRLVGMSPGRFRTCARALADLPVGEVLTSMPDVSGRTLHGRVSPRPDGASGATIVALFPVGIPQQTPSACAVATSTGSFTLPAPDQPAAGTAALTSLLAVSVRSDATIGAVLTEERSAGLYVGSGAVHAGQVRDTGSLRDDITLRPPAVTDPPVLTAFPLLIGARPGYRLPA